MLVILGLGLSGPMSLAQHQMHNMPGSGAPGVKTMPANDEVLRSPPQSIMLSFESAMQLVKLVVKDPDQGKEPIDIGFRYRPGKDVHFVQSLPVLARANYYVVEWAAFDTRQTLVKGTFYFSFGDDAMPPSHYLNRIKRPAHIMSPSYRLL